MSAVTHQMSDVSAELQRLRDSIDNLDAVLVHTLAERFKCTQKVGELKAHHRLPPADPIRESTQIKRLRSLAETAKLNPDFAEKFLTFIVKEVIRHHESISMTGGVLEGGSEMSSSFPVIPGPRRRSPESVTSAGSQIGAVSGYGSPLSRG